MGRDLRKVKSSITKVRREIKKMFSDERKNLLKAEARVVKYITEFRKDRDYSYISIVDFCNGIAEYCECDIGIPDSLYDVQLANEGEL